MSDRMHKRKVVRGWRWVAVAWLLTSACVSLDGSHRATSTPGGERVAGGDLARVHYTVRHLDGTPVADDVLRQGAAAAPSGNNAISVNETVLAGAEARFPGIGAALIGMHAGQRKTVELPAAHAFGVRRPEDVIQLPREQTLSTSMQVPALVFQRRFGGQATPGREVQVLPSIHGTVVEAGDSGVTLHLTADEGAVVSRPFGTTRIHQDGDAIHIRFDPVLGSKMPIKGRTGWIVAADDAQVTVDFNHPHAGEDYVIDLAVDAVTKAADLAGWTIPWAAEPEHALVAAGDAQRPTVLLLYADWCPHCQRLFREVLVDPRITDLRDRFVWVKVNSDLHREYQQTYDQTGFPLIVVLGPDGKVVRRLDGFRDALTLRGDLLAATGPRPHA